MSNLTFTMLESTGDKELEIIKENYDKPSVERFVEINKEKFWTYVTETENVYFYKIYKDAILVGTAQCELYDGILYLALVVFPEYQNKGIGSDIVKYIIDGRTGLYFNKIQVSIDRKNTASMRIFQKAGFSRIGNDGGLIEFQHNM